jgi:hypothetical protein
MYIFYNEKKGSFVTGSYIYITIAQKALSKLLRWSIIFSYFQQIFHLRRKTLTNLQMRWNNFWEPYIWISIYILI